MTRIFLFGLAALGAAACGETTAHPPTAERHDGEGYEVEAETVPLLLPVEGTVAARHRAEISTRLMARVTEVTTELGARVREGQTVIRLGTEDVAANRMRAEAAAEAARAGRDEAARHLQRMDTLYESDAVARVQRDQARLALTQAESQLAMAEAALHEVATTAEYARIKAPFTGSIVARMVDPGDLAAPGQPLLVIESGGVREAVLAVPADVAAALSVGDSLDVVTRDRPTVTGRIRAVAGGADPVTRTVEVRVELASDWPTGISVTGLVPAGTRAAVTVPVASVIRRGQLTGVRVVTESGVALRWIRLGRALGERVEVLSGLEAGERIAL